MLRSHVIQALIIAGALVAACAKPPPTGPKKEKFAEGMPCRQTLHTILEQINKSQAMQCSKDQDCALIANPSTPEKAYRLAVHARDGDRLGKHATEHLKRCGAFRRHKETGQFRTVMAKCLLQRCKAEANTLDLEE